MQIAQVQAVPLAAGARLQLHLEQFSRGVEMAVARQQFVERNEDLLPLGRHGDALLVVRLIRAVGVELQLARLVRPNGKAKRCVTVAVEPAEVQPDAHPGDTSGVLEGALADRPAAVFDGFALILAAFVGVVIRLLAIAELTNSLFRASGKDFRLDDLGRAPLHFLDRRNIRRYRVGRLLTVAGVVGENAWSDNYVTPSWRRFRSKLQKKHIIRTINNIFL